MPCQKIDLRPLCASGQVFDLFDAELERTWDDEHEEYDLVPMAGYYVGSTEDVYMRAESCALCAMVQHVLEKSVSETFTNPHARALTMYELTMDHFCEVLQDQTIHANQQDQLIPRAMISRLSIHLRKVAVPASTTDVPCDVSVGYAI